MGSQTDLCLTEVLLNLVSKFLTLHNTGGSYQTHAEQSQPPCPFLDDVHGGRLPA